MLEFGAFGKLPFVFHAHMSSCHMYIRPDDCVYRMAIVLVSHPNCYGLMVRPLILKRVSTLSRFGHTQVCRPSLRTIDFPLLISYTLRGSANWVH